MGLHAELAADGGVVVQHQVVHAGLAQFFPHGQSGRTGADDGHRGLVDAQGLVRLSRSFHFPESIRARATDLPDPVHGRDADAADVSVHQHLAGAALADSAFHGAVAVLEAVMMHGEAGLMQGGGDGLPFLAAYGFAFK